VSVDDVSDAWERNAREWLAWARAPDHDVYHWRLNFPAFVSLLPPAGARTLDVGCGEGRVGRWLAAHDHRVTGIDSSPTLSAAAREGGGYDEVVDGDAASLPWPADTFDLAVGYMCLQDLPDPSPVIAEIARVLRPGGWLALATVHPLNRPDEHLDRYFETLRFHDEVARDGLRMTFEGVDRPLSDYTAALADNGFVIDRLGEPRPTVADCRAHESLRKAARRPYFLHLRCRLGAR
jgi:SAM-dependent methyltransferase